jgi:hypothetical protein
MVRTALASFKTLPNAIVVLPELAKFLDKIFEEIEEIAIRLSMGAVTTQPIAAGTIRFQKEILHQTLKPFITHIDLYIRSHNSINYSFFCHRQIFVDVTA